MNHCLEYQEEQFKHLYNYLVGATQNIINLEKLVGELQKAVAQFSKSLQSIGEKFHEQINSGSGDSDILVCSYQQLSNYLLRVAQNWGNIASQLQTEVSEPFQQFITNYRATNRQAISDGKQNMKEILQTRDQMMRSQQDFWKSMSTSEKGVQQVERIVEAVDRGTKTKDDFQKVFDRSFKMRQVAEEAEQDYKKLIEITNKKWDQFDKSSQVVYNQTDMNDENRIRFSKQTIFQTIKILTNNQDQLPFEYYEEKFKEIDGRAKEDQRVGLKKKKRKYRSQIQKAQNVPIRKEEFISFEQYKQIYSEKSDQAIDVDTASGQWVLVGDSLVEDERTQIDHYIDFLLSSENVQDPKDQVEPEEQKLIQDSNRKSNQPNNSLAYQQLAISMKHLLQKSTARTYFTDTFSRRYQKANIYYLYLYEDTFNDLVNIIRHWLNYIDMNETYDCEEMYRLLQLSTRVIKKQAVSKQLNSRINLASCIGELDIWQKIQKWQLLYQFICSKKIEEKRKKAQTLMRSSSGGGVLGKGLGILGKGLSKVIGRSAEEKININEGEVVYLILEEVNLFLISLQLNSKISTNVILTLAFQHNQVHLEKDQLSKLIEKQENRNNSHLRRQLTSSKSIKDQKEAKFDRYGLSKYEFKAIYAIQLSLGFLNIYDKPENLLLVNKNFNQRLARKVKKFYILNPGVLYSEITEPLRNKFIQRYFKLDKCDINYVQMKVQVGIEMYDQMSSIEEIISLDVQRSLHIHQQKISSSILQSLLRTYSYFNPDVSYAQGMNYIAGYLYLTFGDEETSYKVFHYVMLDYFRQIFVNDFAQLKQMFYQFDRMFSVFLPELSEHFKEEKIDPSYYASSWFITMFSSVFQYSMRSAFLNIIWDLFIAESWKGFYKVAFFILSLLQPKLIKFEFEDILHCLGEIVRSELFQIDTEEKLINYVRELQGKPKIEKPSVSLKQEIQNKFKISNQLIRKLEVEYNHFNLNFNNKIKEYQK